MEPPHEKRFTLLQSSRTSVERLMRHDVDGAKIKQINCEGPNGKDMWYVGGEWEQSLY